jgi:hypothetical protein
VADTGSSDGHATRRAVVTLRRLLQAAMVGFLLFTGLACGASPFTADPGPDRDLLAGRGVYWGASIGPQLTGTQAPGDPQAITAFEHEVGKHLSIVNTGWVFAVCGPQRCGPADFPEPALQTIRAAGAIPLVSMESTPIGGTRYDARFTLASIAAGRWDGLLWRYAREIRRWGHPFFLRFDWEMNSSVWPWDPPNNASTPAAYVAAWRHVHDLFARAGVRNVTWVWCPNVGNLRNLGALYPGRRYVDWSCLDGYNFGGTSAVSFADWNAIFARSYALITQRLAPGKPMMVAEFGSTGQGGDKAAWITNALATVPFAYPQIRALVYYDFATGGANWSLESSPRVLRAFARGVARPVYVSHLSRVARGGKIVPPRLPQRF